MLIAAPYTNPDHVRKDKQKVLETSGLPRHGDSFFNSIISFDVENPDFSLPDGKYGAVTIVCFQSTFMRERLSEVLRVEEQVHGLVSDAAHKIFKDRSKLLITTSSYSPIIKRWLPVLYSFNNGGTIEHFRHHFLTLFRSLVRQRNDEGLQVTENDFTMVRLCPASHACTTHILLNRSLILLLLREGFILAYIDLHLESSHEKRSRQLRDAAKQCLKGCQEHLRAAVV